MVTKWENDGFELFVFLVFFFFQFLLYFVSEANTEQNEEKESEANVRKGKLNNRARGGIYSKKEVKFLLFLSRSNIPISPDQSFDKPGSYICFD